LVVLTTSVHDSSATHVTTCFARVIYSYQSLFRFAPPKLCTSGNMIQFPPKRFISGDMIQFPPKQFISGDMIQFPPKRFISGATCIFRKTGSARGSPASSAGIESMNQFRPNSYLQTKRKKIKCSKGHSFF
jgi:hypothetical protein